MWAFALTEGGGGRERDREREREREKEREKKSLLGTILHDEDQEKRATIQARAAADSKNIKSNTFCNNMNETDEDASCNIIYIYNIYIYIYIYIYYPRWSSNNLYIVM